MLDNICNRFLTYEKTLAVFFGRLENTPSETDLNSHDLFEELMTAGVNVTSPGFQSFLAGYEINFETVIEKIGELEEPKKPDNYTIFRDALVASISEAQKLQVPQTATDNGRIQSSFSRCERYKNHLKGSETRVADPEVYESKLMFTENMLRVIKKPVDKGNKSGKPDTLTKRPQTQLRDFQAYVDDAETSRILNQSNDAIGMKLLTYLRHILTGDFISRSATGGVSFLSDPLTHSQKFLNSQRNGAAHASSPGFTPS